MPRPDYIDFTKFGGYEVVDGYNCTRWQSDMYPWFTVDTQVPVLFGNGPQWGRPKVYALHYDTVSLQRVAPDRQTLPCLSSLNHVIPGPNAQPKVSSFTVNNWHRV